jgi:hypothetical protein
LRDAVVAGGGDEVETGESGDELNDFDCDLDFILVSRTSDLKGGRKFPAECTVASGVNDENDGNAVVVEDGVSRLGGRVTTFGRAAAEEGLEIVVFVWDL